MRRGAWVPGTSLPSGLYNRHGGGPGGIRARRAGPARRPPASRPNPPYAQVSWPPGLVALRVRGAATLAVKRLVAAGCGKVLRKNASPPANPGRLARPSVAYTNLLKTAL